GRFTGRFVELFGPPRKDDTQELEQRHYDIAAAAQKTFEQVLFHCVNHLHEVTREEALCLSGGAAMNCVANGRIRAETRFRNVYVPYAPDDSGNSIGAALYVYHDILGKPRVPPTSPSTSLLGPEWSNDAIARALEKYGIAYESSEHVIDETVALLEAGAVVAWFQGKMEFGQRAL